MRRPSLALLGGVRHALSCSLVVLSCVSLANAAPINYDEAVDGDLPNSDPLTILALDVGTNTVAGTITYIPNWDLDSFAFTVPASTRLVSANVELVDAVGDFGETHWGFYSGSANWVGGTHREGVTVSSPGSYIFSSVPLGPGTYNLSHRSVSNSESNSSADYVFTFVVESTLLAVPEPSTLALSVLGLMGLAFRRRRQRS